MTDEQRIRDLVRRVVYRTVGRAEPTVADAAPASRLVTERDVQAVPVGGSLPVPAGALVQRQGAFALWVADGAGKASTVRVSVLGQEGEEAVIAEPEALPAGARCIDTPPLGVSEGALVAELER